MIFPAILLTGIPLD